MRTSERAPNRIKLKDPRKIWDELFAQLLPDKVGHSYEPWLEPWLSTMESSRPSPILDVGCGVGLDGRYLSDKGFRVIAADYSRNALELACRVAKQSGLVQADLRQGLPFFDRVFLVVIANLSLHCFRWDETEKVVAEIGRCLRRGGYLLARVNSTRDHNYGAIGYERVEGNLYRVRGMHKRFFNREEIDRLFAKGWTPHGTEEKVIHCYHKPKVIWEIVLQKC